MSAIARKLLFGLMGWKEHVTVPRHDKCVICVAPHTSNWDFIIAKLYYYAIGRKARFMMKKEWFFFPLGLWLRHIGGVPVVRSKKTSLTDQMAQQALEADHFELALTPEGTRSRVTTWKRGFYYIALKAQIPILLYALDYEEKLIQCIHTVIPNGDVEKQMRDIKLYFKDFKGRHPEKFTIGNID